MEASNEYIEVAELIRQRLGKRRKFVVAVDGTDRSGKSTVARYLGWQLGMSVVETDLCNKPGVHPIETDPEMLGRAVEGRLKINRPVIVEGITVMQSLSEIGLEPHFLLKMRNTGFEGSGMFQEKLATYRKNFESKREPDFEIVWSSEQQCKS